MDSKNEKSNTSELENYGNTCEGTNETERSCHVKLEILFKIALTGKGLTFSETFLLFRGEVGDLKMTIEELERALRDVRNQLSRKNSEIQQLQQRKQSMLELQGSTHF